MRLSDIERKSKIMGINETWLYSRKELIRKIQQKERNQECFAKRMRSTCGQMSCCWRSNCT